MVYFIFKSIFFAILKIWCRMETFGVENLPKTGGFILASNHLSYADPPAVGVNCKRRLNYMAKEELFSKPLIAWWLNSVGCIPVKRNSGDLSALREAIRRLRAGEGLLLFPQGTRIQGGRKLEPHSGIGFLAAKLGVPVIPACVIGTDKVLPRGTKFIKPAKVSVCFGKQIRIDSKMPYENAASLIMEKIRQLQKFS